MFASLQFTHVNHLSDALSDNLDRVPLLPYVLSKGKNKKRKTTQVLPLQTPAFIHITRKDNLNVEQKIQDTVRAYGLNEDQEKYDVHQKSARHLISNESAEYSGRLQDL